MASARRHTGGGVTGEIPKPPDPAQELLLAEPWRFEFAQALRILLRNSEHGRTGEPADRRFDVDREPVRVGANPTMGFPASDVQSLEPIPDTERRKMLINFLGLTGPTGVLPQPYTEFIIERTLDNDHSPAEFFDIFNHRLSMLFYYAWERYRFPVTAERLQAHDLFRRILLSLAGLGTEGLTDRMHVSDDFIARYAAILAIQPRSASGLQTILADYFQAPVEIEQFAGTWYPLDEDSTTRFRPDESEAERLGQGVVVSEEYWSQESMVCVRIGPLDLATFRLFLRGGPNFERLRDICRFFSRDEQVFEVQLILHRDEVPGASLEEQGSQLGWTTWAKSKPFSEHAEDVIIRL
jgi:type VI secretion system protein ImpH